MVMSYSSVKGTVTRGASGLLAFAQRQLDRVVSADARQKTYNAVIDFAQERPLLASLILTHLFFSFTPLLIFSVFILSTAIFAFSTALLFSLFWFGVALLVLVPTLLLTSTIAFFAYAWGLSSYIFIKQVSGWVPGLEGKMWGPQQPRVNGHGNPASPQLDGPSYAEVAAEGQGNENGGGNDDGGNTANADGYLL